jgi:DnaK suppressor protein
MNMAKKPIKKVKKATKYKSKPVKVKKKIAKKKVAKKPVKKVKKAKKVKKVKKVKKKIVAKKQKSTEKVAKKSAKKAVKAKPKKVSKKPAKRVAKKAKGAAESSAGKQVKKSAKKAVKKLTKDKKSVTIERSANMGSKQEAKSAQRTGRKPIKSRSTRKPAEDVLEAELDMSTAAGSLGFAAHQPKEGEEYMGPTQEQHFRQILTSWKHQLMQEVDSTVVHMKEDVMSFADPLDRASQEEGFSLELRTRDRERKLLKKIEKALDLIDQGDYGFCEDCGAEIGVRRLEARPTAEKCIDCKTFEEIREKQSGG